MRRVRSFCLYLHSHFRFAHDIIDGLYACLLNTYAGIFISLITVPTVAFAVGNNQYTVNPNDFAFGDAGNGMTFGGVGHIHLLLSLRSLSLTML